MFVTFLHGPARVLASIFTILGFLPLIGGESAPRPTAPATVQAADPTSSPTVEFVGPTVAPLDTPIPTAVVPLATGSVVVRVITSQTVDTPQTAHGPQGDAAPQLFVATRPAAAQPSTAAPAAPSPTATPRLYPTNREVGILRPATTPTPAAYRGQKLGSAVPGRVARWEPEILAAAQRYELDPNLIAALMQTESQGEAEAVSRANAVGLLQVVDGPSDPQANVLLGTKMLVHNLRLFDEDLELALAAYNAGPGNVLQYKGVPPFAETQAHVGRTLDAYEQFRRSS